jgi:hypothetical protein
MSTQTTGITIEHGDTSWAMTAKEWVELANSPAKPHTTELCDECGLPLDECNRRYYARRGWWENPKTGMIEPKPTDAHAKDETS